MNEIISVEKRFRYDCSGKWFKGSVHVHTDRSSGRLPLSEVTAFYAEAGYDFVCITDKIVPFIGKSDDKYPLLVLNGIEVEGDDDQGSFYHVVCIEGVDGVTGDTKLSEVIKRVRAQGGILVWAHPHSVNNTVEEGLRHGFDGIEVFNSINQVAFGKGLAVYHWDASLVRQPDMLGFATDDAHFLRGVPAEKGGWIMVNAPELSRDAIVASIRKGNFYSSTGPLFKSISIREGNRIMVETSPVIYTRLVGTRGESKFKGTTDREPMTEVHFRLPDVWTYARLEIEDAMGKKAWSNPLLISKL
jgi:hypothetical protein